MSCTAVDIADLSSPFLRLSLLASSGHHHDGIPKPRFVILPSPRSLSSVETPSGGRSEFDVDVCLMPTPLKPPTMMLPPVKCTDCKFVGAFVTPQKMTKYEFLCEQDVKCPRRSCS